MQKVLLIILVFSSIGQCLAQSAELQRLYTEKYYAQQRNEPEKALEWGIKTVAQAEKEFGKAGLYANYAFDLATLCTQLSEFERADELYKECIAIYEKEMGKTHEYCGTGWMNLGINYYYQGDYKASEECLTTAETIYKNQPGGPSQFLPQLYQWLLPVCQQNNSYAKLITLTEEGLKKIHKDSLDYSISLSNLAYYNQELRKFDVSDSYYQLALASLERQLKNNDPQHLLVLDNYGIMLAESNQFAKALKIFEKNLKEYQSLYGKDSYAVAKTLNNLAFAQKGMGDLAGAEQRYLDALAIYREAGYADSVVAIGTLVNLGGLYEERKDFGASEKHFREAMAAYARAGMTDSPENLAAANNLANVLSELDKFEEAEKLYQESLVVKEEVFGQDHYEYAATLASLGHLYERRGDYAQAQQRFEEASLVVEKTPGKETEYGHLLQSIAYSYRLQGKFEDAVVLFKKAMKLAEGRSGRDGLEYAAGAHLLGLTYDAMGLYTRAEPMLEDCEKIRRKKSGETHPDYAIILNDLGLHYQQTGQYTLAGSYFKKSLQIKEKVFGPENSSCAVSWNNLGIFYFDTGDYGLSEIHYKKALKIYEKAFGKMHPHYANALANLGRLYFEFLQPQKAANALSEAYQIQKQVLGERHPNTLNTLNFAGSLYRQTGQYDLAEETFKECLRIRGEVLGKEHPSYLDALVNLGDLFRMKAQFDEAGKYYSEAMAVGKRTLGKDHVIYITYLNNLAILYTDQHQFEKARPLLEEVYAARRKQFSAGHPELINIQSNLADVYYRLKRYDQAETLFKQVNQARLKQIRQLFPYLSERERGTFVMVARSEFNSFSQFVFERSVGKPELLGELFNLQIASKGLLLNTQNEFARAIARTNQPELLREYGELKNLKERLAKVYKISAEERARQNIDLIALENQAEDLEKKINLQVKLGSDLPDWKQLQKELAPGEALTEMVKITYYVPGDADSSAYLALLATPLSKNTPNAVWLRNGRALDTRFLKYYQNAIKFQKDDLFAYDQYWSPLGKELAKQGIKKVYFAPDGVYNQINLNTLSVPTSGKYLLEETDIHLLANPRDLILAKRREKSTESKISKRAELFGFPDYDTHALSGLASYAKADAVVRPVTAGDTRSFSSIADLPGTRSEVENIGKILSAGGLTVTTHTREKASEARIKSLGSLHILHIATHGFFSADEVFKTDVAEEDNSVFASNPLLRSGLLMAGAKRAFLDEEISAETEDGVLTAYEAMNLQLEGAELVVLSACETGLGEVQNGEGVFGLQRAFLAAGARSLIMSLWTVSDEATQELMTKFYELWMETNDKRASFKQAQAELKIKYPHPFYWGAFVMVGE